jgi:hypothetical protein
MTRNEILNGTIVMPLNNMKSNATVEKKMPGLGKCTAQKVVEIPAPML